MTRWAYYVIPMNIQLDIKCIERRLSQVENAYTQHAFVQKEIARRVFERLDFIRIQPAAILDLSLNIADSAEILRSRFPEADYQSANPLFSLSIPPSSIDFIFMNLSLAWLNDWPHRLVECRQVLKPGGLILFTSLGPDTLKELREAFKAVDQGRHVHDFVDMHHLGDVLVKAGFENPIMDMEHLTINYKSVDALVQDLKKTGANNAWQGRSIHVMTPAQWQKMVAHYPKDEASDKIPATVEIIYGHAWVSEQQRQRVDEATGDIHVPFPGLSR